MNASELTSPHAPTGSAANGGSSVPWVGSGDYRYRPEVHWAKVPAGYGWSEVASVACDSKGRVYVFNRGPHPMMVFERDGTFVRSWGEGIVVRAHGLAIGPDDTLYCTEDHGHVVRTFTTDGRLLMTLGDTQKPSATGATSMDFRGIRQSSGPFHYPTNLALGPQGDMFVTDGYGNARIHRFSPDGRLLRSWGEPGAGPGQFAIPHGIAIDPEGLLYVADRENSRIQVFTPEGQYVRELTGIARPCEVAFDARGNLLVAELGYKVAMWPGIPSPGPDAPGGRVSVLTRDGEVLARWGGGTHPTRAGDFFAPHDIYVDSHGDLYVSEVIVSAAGSSAREPSPYHSLQKFHRVTESTPS
ncbi:MAG: hypothetical protein JNL97_11160 [Verrucomicrobiales bacterium]|nr:hypothetical protein [Verrucomicrobiales bacterium]